MAKKRTVKKSGKKTKPRSRGAVAASGRRKPARKAVGAKKKAARKAAVKRGGPGAKPARKPAKKGAKTALRKVAAKAAGPLPKKMTAQKKRAALSMPKPAAEVGVREVQTTAPESPVGMGEAPAGRPLQVSDVVAAGEAGGNEAA